MGQVVDAFLRVARRDRGGLDQGRGFKALEDENRRLREIVTGICVDWGVSIRKACGDICFDTSSCHDKSRRTDQAAFERWIKEFARYTCVMAMAHAS